MTRGQFFFVASLVVLFAAIVIGSLFLPFYGFALLMVAIFILADQMRKEITPDGSTPPSPMQILEHSFFWRAVAVGYTFILIAVVVWHLGVARLSFFEHINLPILLLLILGPAAGPIAINIATTYRMLGSDWKGSED